MVIIVLGFVLLVFFSSNDLIVLVVVLGVPLACIFLAFNSGYLGRPGTANVSPECGGIRLLPTFVVWCIVGIPIWFILHGGGGDSSTGLTGIVRLTITVLLGFTIPGAAITFSGSKYRQTRRQAYLLIPIVCLLVLLAWLNYCEFDWTYATGVTA